MPQHLGVAAEHFGMLQDGQLGKAAAYFLVAPGKGLTRCTRPSHAMASNAIPYHPGRNDYKCYQILSNFPPLSAAPCPAPLSLFNNSRKPALPIGTPEKALVIWEKGGTGSFSTAGISSGGRALLL